MCLPGRCCQTGTLEPYHDIFPSRHPTRQPRSRLKHLNNRWCKALFTRSWDLKLSRPAKAIRVYSTEPDLDPNVTHRNVQEDEPPELEDKSSRVATLEKDDCLMCRQSQENRCASFRVVVFENRRPGILREHARKRWPPFTPSHSLPTHIFHHTKTTLEISLDGNASIKPPP